MEATNAIQETEAQVPKEEIPVKSTPVKINWVDIVEGFNPDDIPVVDERANVNPTNATSVSHTANTADATANDIDENDGFRKGRNGKKKPDPTDIYLDKATRASPITDPDQRPRDGREFYSDQTTSTASPNSHYFLAEKKRKADLERQQREKLEFVSRQIREKELMKVGFTPTREATQTNKPSSQQLNGGRLLKFESDEETADGSQDLEVPTLSEEEIIAIRDQKLLMTLRAQQKAEEIRLREQQAEEQRKLLSSRLVQKLEAKKAGTWQETAEIPAPVHTQIYTTETEPPKSKEDAPNRVTDDEAPHDSEKKSRRKGERQNKTKQTQDKQVEKGLTTEPHKQDSERDTSIASPTAENPRKRETKTKPAVVESPKFVIILKRPPNEAEAIKSEADSVTKESTTASSAPIAPSQTETKQPSQITDAPSANVEQNTKVETTIQHKPKNHTQRNAKPRDLQQNTEQKTESAKIANPPEVAKEKVHPAKQIADESLKSTQNKPHAKSNHAEPKLQTNDAHSLSAQTSKVHTSKGVAYRRKQASPIEADETKPADSSFSLSSPSLPSTVAPVSVSITLQDAKVPSESTPTQETKPATNSPFITIKLKPEPVTQQTTQTVKASTVPYAGEEIPKVTIRLAKESATKTSVTAAPGDESGVSVGGLKKSSNISVNPGVHQKQAETKVTLATTANVTTTTTVFRLPINRGSVAKSGSEKSTNAAIVQGSRSTVNSASVSASGSAESSEKHGNRFTNEWTTQRIHVSTTTPVSAEIQQEQRTRGAAENRPRPQTHVWVEKSVHPKQSRVASSVN